VEDIQKTDTRDLEAAARMVSVIWMTGSWRRYRKGKCEDKNSMHLLSMNQMHRHVVLLLYGPISRTSENITEYRFEYLQRAVVSTRLSH